MTNPESIKCKWSFAGSSGNSSLCNHLENHHKNEYLHLCEVNGWTNMLPKMRKESKSAIAANPGGPSAPHTPFSQSRLLKVLVNFIVADDQVQSMLHQYYAANHITFQSMNVVECHEFCNLLLLLWEDLQDKDIPHRTKICESIITAWKSWFVGLKSELAVSTTNFF